MRPHFLILFLSSLGLLASDDSLDDVSVQDPISSSIRAHWIRRAVAALSELTGSPCPAEAFGAVIVNHTASAEGALVCMGVNSIKKDGNPTLHGEISAINNCSTLLTSPDGPYKLTGREALSALSQLSLYTTAEACPMCATAIRYALFAEYIYATSSDTLIDAGWPQINITSREVFARSVALPKQTRIVKDVLRNETDVLFGWQYRDGECPSGCARKGEICTHSEDSKEGHGEL